MGLSLKDPLIIVDKYYYLRDPAIDIIWSQTNLVDTGVLVDCGLLVVDFSMADGEEIDSSMFTVEDESFIVKYTERVNL